MHDKTKIAVNDFGKDHWSLLAYIETCCVDSNGKFDLRRIRVNPKTHPQHAVDILSDRKWSSNYGTILNGGRVLPDHDDIDCLEDLERLGFIYIKSLVSEVAVLSPMGIIVSNQIRNHKASGGKYSDFKISPICEG